MNESLAGKLLLAHPGLRDPNFYQTIIFLATHDEAEGAIGWIVNRPLPRPISELLPDTDLGPLADCPVLLGGPVAGNQLTFAELAWDAALEQLEFRHNLLLPEARELALLHPERLRAFVGYAGWSAGQLEQEIEASAWVVHDAGPEALKVNNASGAWRSLIGACGPWFRLAANEPDDLSKN